MIDPFFGGMLSAGVGLLGNIFGAKQQNEYNQQMQQQTQAFNASQAQMNRDFQEQMSNTAYQRASADMQKAGLNPAMMFSSGSAASSPGGAMAAPVPPAQKTSALSSLGPAAEKLVSSAISLKTFDKMVEEIANLRTTNEKLQAETATERTLPALMKLRAITEMNTGAIKAHQIPQERLKGKEAASEEQLLETTPGQILQQGARVGRQGAEIVKPIGDIIHSAGSVVRALKSPVNTRWPDKYETIFHPSGRKTTKETIYNQ